MRRAALLALLAAAPAPAARWTPVAAPGVEVTLAESAAGGVKIVYDFRGGSGWAGARRPLARDLPSDWTLSFRVRGTGPANTLEIKLLDATGENVWWTRREAFAPPAAWQTIDVRKRQVRFAWGPGGGGDLRRLSFLEIVLSAGQGGRGFLEVEDPVLVERPSAATLGSPRVRAVPSGILVDLGGSRELSALVVDWPAELSPPPSFSLEISSDGRTFRPVRRVARGGARRAYLHLPDTEARFLRMSLPPGRFGIPRVDVLPVEAVPTATDLLQRVARDAPRGLYPRAFRGEQAYWTVVGADGDSEEALVGEDGAIEPGKGSFSLEPFLFAGGRLVTWSDAAISHSLERGDLPIPTVTWTAAAAKLDLDVTALADGPEGASRVTVRYRVRNTAATPARVRLFAAVRPLLVNPPTQFLNAPHGASRIESLAFRGGELEVNGSRRIAISPAPSAFGAASFDEGFETEFLLKGRTPAAAEVRDETCLASGAFAWDLEVAPGGGQSVFLDVPLHAGTSVSPLTLSKKIFEDGLTRASKAWGDAVDRVRFQVPPSAEVLVRTLRSNLAYVLVNRDGPWLRPGSRAYERSWIRDGALTSSALLRLGHPAEVKEFLVAFAAKQFPDGKIPCCVDARGADPVPENDSHGELLFLAAEYFRYTGDRETLQALWPRIGRTVAAIDALRKQRLGSEYDAPAKRAFRGLLPESISHEGYSDRPVHSYWDDAFARKGLADAAWLAAALGYSEEAGRWRALADAFEKDLLASIDETMRANGLDTIPASVEKHDFDPTSTTVSLEPGGLGEKLPREALRKTFDRYVAETRARGAGARKDGAYTPYELRAVGALVRLDKVAEAHELLAGFLADRRPAAWNQWAEVVGLDARAPRFLGDMPHTWVGSDFIRSFLDFFALVRGNEGEESLLLGSGFPEEWVRTAGAIGVEGLRTPWGVLDFSESLGGGGLKARIAGIRLPPGGLFLSWSLPGLPRNATVNGKPATVRGREIAVDAVPAEVVALP